MKRANGLFMIVVAVSFLFAPWPAKAETAAADYPDYFAIKGGYYYPTEPIRLNEFNRTDFNKKKGFEGELAFGRHFGTFFGLELGVGYIEDRRFPFFGPGRTKLEAAPVLLSAKLFLPIGIVEPYIEVGGGAYFTKFEEETLLGTRNFRKTAFGPHAGVGVNVNLTNTFYVGVEGRFRRIRPEFGGETVRLNGYTLTANIGFRYK